MEVRIFVPSFIERRGFFSEYAGDGKSGAGQRRVKVLERMAEQYLSVTFFGEKGRTAGTESIIFKKIFLFPLDGAQNGITYCV